MPSGVATKTQTQGRICIHVKGMFWCRCWPHLTLGIQTKIRATCTIQRQVSLLKTLKVIISTFRSPYNASYCRYMLPNVYEVLPLSCSPPWSALGLIPVSQSYRDKPSEDHGGPDLILGCLLWWLHPAFNPRLSAVVGIYTGIPSKAELKEK
jgi:hypothetical protein